MENKVEQQIREFIDLTKRHKIDWATINPKAYRFVKNVNNRNFTITIQEHPTKPEINYILTIQSTNPNEVLLQIKSHEKSTYRALLEELLQAAIDNTKVQNIREIDKLLNSLNKE